MRRIRFNWRTYSTRSLANNCMSSQVRRLAYNTALCFPPQEPTHTHRTRINAMASPCNWFHSERRCALLPSKHWQNVCNTHSLSIYTIYIYILPVLAARRNYPLFVDACGTPDVAFTFSQENECDNVRLCAISVVDRSLYHS